jgi:hypothetical protein
MKKVPALRRDQYKRVVTLPLIPHTPWPRRHRGRGWCTRLGIGSCPATTRNLPLEVVRVGWGAVYAQKGAEYGNNWGKGSVPGLAGRSTAPLLWSIGL